MDTLKERLHAGLTDAMRARDDVARAALRLTLSAVSKAEVAGAAQTTLSDAQVVALVRTEIKRRHEAAEIFRTNGRQELADREEAEAAVLAPYLPAELDDDALGAVVTEEVQRAAAGGLAGPKATGAVIKAVQQRVGQAATGGRIAALVRAALA